MSNIRLYPFLTAYEQTYSLHGVKMSEDEFMDYAYTAWEQIGSIDTEIKHMILCPVKIHEHKYCSDLPCDLSIIESVTVPRTDYVKSTNKTYNTISLNATIENNIESSRVGYDQLYGPGEFVEYDRYDNTIITYLDYGELFLVYKSEVLGDDELPMLNAKQVDAIVNFCVYIHLNKQGLRNRDQATMQIAAMYKQEWIKSKFKARSPEYINQNEMNDILEVVSSSDRKVHSLSYKPIK